jgi:invasion protein IalB
MKRKLSILLISIILALILFVLIFVLPSNKVTYWPSSNVESVKTSCSIACSNNNSYDYCYVRRDVNDRKNSKIAATCYNLANSNNYSGRDYNIAPCSEIDCSNSN